MVMPWSCSSDSASSRKAYSNGLPVRWHSRRTASSLPVGSEPVSASRRPTRVDLPWSTWPTMTMFIASRDCAAGSAEVEVAGVVMVGPGGRGDAAAGSHVAVFAQLFEAVLAVLQAARALGDVL